MCDKRTSDEKSATLDDKVSTSGLGLLGPKLGFLVMLREHIRVESVRCRICSVADQIIG